MRQGVYEAIYFGSSDLLFESWIEILSIWKINTQNGIDSYVFNHGPLAQLRANNNQSEYLLYETKNKTDFTNSSVSLQMVSIKKKEQDRK